MRQDEFDAYMRRYIAPVQPGTAFDERTRRTLAQLPPVKKQRRPLTRLRNLQSGRRMRRRPPAMRWKT